MRKIIEQSWFSNLHPVASFTKELNQRLAKRPLVCNGRLANHVLTSLVKETTDDTWSQVLPDLAKWC